MARARRSAPETNGAPYAPRLKRLYEQELRPRLKEELGLATVMEVPRIEKITLNMGVGEAKTDDQAFALLRALGMPFAADGREQ